MLSGLIPRLFGAARTGHAARHLIIPETMIRRQSGELPDCQPTEPPAVSIPQRTDDFGRDPLRRQMPAGRVFAIDRSSDECLLGRPG